MFAAMASHGYYEPAVWKVIETQSSLMQDQGATLTAHNTARANHQASALVWDSTAASAAQLWVCFSVLIQ